MAQLNQNQSSSQPLQPQVIHKEIVVTNETYHYDPRFPLLSIHLASFRPDQFTEFVHNVQSTISNPNGFEIIVKIDTEDQEMIACVTELVKLHGEDKIKPLIRPRKEGPWSLWEFYNEAFLMTHEKAYFTWLPSDEVRFLTNEWDKILEKYIGFFKDNIFRLKLSENRLRNFYQVHEVLGCPDNFPFITKKWMDLCGLWGDCHSPDLFQQGISYYLGREYNTFRDIPIFEIELGGLEAGLLIPPEKLASRTQNIHRLWLFALSKPMRSRYIAHASKIKFFIDSCKQGATTITCKEKITYPSKVFCSNDLGTTFSKECRDDRILPYSIRLSIIYFLDSYIKPFLKTYINPSIKSKFKNFVKCVIPRKQPLKKIIVRNELYNYDHRFPLISIHLASFRPDQFTKFVENVQTTASHSNCFEIIVKIDTEDKEMISCVTELVKLYGANKIKPLIRPRKRGPWSLWEFYNEAYLMMHKKAYFAWLPSDEVRFVTKDWDKILEKYIGFFKDNVFRLKLSENRLRNFYQVHEVLGCPDNFPFITKKWMDLCGLWGDCHSPDLFQQAISFYLGKEYNTFRDIPIFDIELGGLEAGLLLPPEKLESRARNIRRLWLLALSKPMRSRYIAHASKIKFFIDSCEQGATTVICKEKTSYPSSVHCTNDISMTFSKECRDNTIFIMFSLRMKTRQFLDSFVMPIFTSFLRPIYRKTLKPIMGNKIRPIIEFIMKIGGKFI